MTSYYRRILKQSEINDRARTDPHALIEEEQQRYVDEVNNLAELLAENAEGHCLAMLSGPSSAGKTTTANKIRLRLQELGVEAYTISMDDFYRGREQAPRLPDGSFDYETLEALRLDKLEQCMQELLKDGCTDLPIFDFVTGSPKPEMTELRIARNAVVIFEGIHAINPYFERHLPSESLFKIFINAVTPIYDQDVKKVARREIRLTRRLLRDERFRNSSVENTLSMWQQVVHGENTYMFPYVDTANYLIDTTHAYEPCIFAPLLLPSLKAVDDGDPHVESARRLAKAIEGFEPLPVDYMPKDSLLREFVGGGIY